MARSLHAGIMSYDAAEGACTALIRHQDDPVPGLQAAILFGCGPVKFVPLIGSLNYGFTAMFTLYTYHSSMTKEHIKAAHACEMDKLEEFKAIFQGKNLVEGTEVAMFWNVGTDELDVLVTPPQQQGFRDYANLQPEKKIKSSSLSRGLFEVFLGGWSPLSHCMLILYLHDDV
eukprot:798349-Pelagomonas_calceolata.AAC.2